MRVRWLAAALCVVAVTAGCTRTGSQHVPGRGAVVAGQPSATATAQPAADGVQQVVIDTTDDNHFKPDAILAKTGKLRITVTNPSPFPVDLEIPSLGVHSTTIFAGNSTTVMVDIPGPGSYPFDCSFHAHQGMTGELTVQ